MGLAAAAAITGVAGIGGGMIASSGAKSAANTQAAAADRGVAEQQREFDINQANYAPWLSAGKGALQQQLDLLGLGGGTPAVTDWTRYAQANPDLMAAYNAMPSGQFNPQQAIGQAWGSLFGRPGSVQTTPSRPDLATFAQQWHQTHGGDMGAFTTGGQTGAQVQQGAIDALKNSPLYQSLYRNGQDALLNNAAATGGLRGGNTEHALANFGSDTLAQVIQQQLSNLGGISGNGMSSAGALGGLNAGTADSISKLYSQQGAAQAGGIATSAGIWNNAFNTVGANIGKILTPGPLLGANGYVTPNMGFVSSVGSTMNNNPAIF